MYKKEKSKSKDMKNQNSEVKKLDPSSNSKKQKDKSLPWWVELLFVQIGLPDKYLIKILKLKKGFKELEKTDKKKILTLFLILVSLAYFYPVVKYSKNKLNCEKVAKNYLLEKKNLTIVDKKQLSMLTTNFCNGGEEIYEIENLKR